MMAIFIPLGVFLLIVLLVYLIGNVYNGLMKRRNRVNNSWYELTKALKRSYDLIPSLLQEAKMDKKTAQELKDIYRRYQSQDIRSLPPYEAASLDEAYQNALNHLGKTAVKDADIFNFISESRRAALFSVPLYNHNVKDYLKFKNMLVNRKMAKLWNFGDIEEFKTGGEGKTITETIDFRFQDTIEQNAKSQ